MSVPVRKRADHTGREAHYTPAWVVDALLQDPHCPEALRPRASRHWVDAGAGDGAIYRAVMRHGSPRFTLVEPYPDTSLIQFARTRHTSLPARVDVRLSVWVHPSGPAQVPEEIAHEVAGADVVISNPPFTLATRFVVGARAACPDAWIVVLQRLGWLDEARDEWFRAYWPDVYVIPRRVAFLRPSGGYQDKMAGLCAWFVWPPAGGAGTEPAPDTRSDAAARAAGHGRPIRKGDSMIWEVREGDALTILPTLPAESVDAIVTDPPYASGGLRTTDRRRGTGNEKYQQSDQRDRYPLFMEGEMRDQRSWTSWMAEVLSGCYRVARPGAVLVLFSDWRVLDPFCGSGSTGVAALRHGLEFVGIEMSQEYAAIARAELRDAETAFAPVRRRDAENQLMLTEPDR